jgi:hypothetical protein
MIKPGGESLIGAEKVSIKPVAKKWLTVSRPKAPGFD